MPNPSRAVTLPVVVTFRLPEGDGRLFRAAATASGVGMSEFARTVLVPAVRDQLVSMASGGGHGNG